MCAFHFAVFFVALPLILSITFYLLFTVVFVYCLRMGSISFCVCGCAAHSYLSFGLLFIPTEKNRFITCNLINFLISSLFLRCVCVSSPFFRCHCVCSFCAVRAIVSAVACLHMREMLSMKWMWFHSSRVSWRVYFFIYIFTHSAKWWTCSVDGIVLVCAEVARDEHMLSLYRNHDSKVRMCKGITRNWFVLFNLGCGMHGERTKGVEILHHIPCVVYRHEDRSEE